MKKLSIFAIAALAMVSCSNTYTAKDAVLTNQNDSLNYALGLVNGAQLKTYQLANDSSDAAVTEFIDALQQGYDGTVEQLDEIAQMGRNIGDAIKASEKVGLAENPTWTLNEEMFFQGLVNGLHGDTTVMSGATARAFYQQAYHSRSGAKAGKAILGKCPTEAKTVALTNFDDSLNYAFGFSNGEQMRMYIFANDSDDSMRNEFIEHINIALKSKVLHPQLVAIGQQIGQAIREQESTGLLGVPSIVTDFELIKQGFINGLYNHTTQLTAEDANLYIEETINNLKYGDTKAAGEKFLEENKLQDGVIVTESGLQYKVIKMGKGKKPVATDKVKVHYHGTLIDGKVFDSSVERGEPITFGLTQVIPGWTEGLQLMPVGSKFIFYIPQELGYGARQAGDIPPYSTLIFEVELLDIEK